MDSTAAEQSLEKEHIRRHTVVSTTVSTVVSTTVFSGVLREGNVPTCRLRVVGY